MLNTTKTRKCVLPMNLTNKEFMILSSNLQLTMQISLPNSIRHRLWLVRIGDLFDTVDLPRSKSCDVLPNMASRDRRYIGQTFGSIDLAIAKSIRIDCQRIKGYIRSKWFVPRVHSTNEMHDKMMLFRLWQ